ncbi:hypothetical protein N5912_09995 [Arcobacter lacus]|uniref:hypothetical protein n=1 Tax=Arcobacter lacus TaxID=1912876 RepID=UPI0021BAEFAB|nr:hypothetical protein [Arcobacter lacus]MCT7912159.1 hypothetical protein [Arcobacter lacus]
MALINCPECNKHEISAIEGSICPNCGFKVNESFLLKEEQKSWGQMRWFFLGLIVFIVVGFVGVILSLANSYLAIAMTIIFVSFIIFKIRNHEFLEKINKNIFTILFLLTGLLLVFINIAEIVK